MTTFGKIMIFLNLVFTLFLFGLIVAVYRQQVNWHNSYVALKAQQEAQVSSYEQLLADASNKVQAAEKRESTAVGAQKGVQEKLDAEVKKTAELQRELQAVKQVN